LFIASAIPSSSPSSTQPAIQSVKILILDTPTGFLRVRDSASLSGKEIAQVKPGEKYDFLSEQTGWFEIKLNDGKTGFISSQYSQKTN
ncbi:MAG: SH3 domain-containing protein, partial [Patescibacteria group bacterium]|nr:SH3 domain-containing protein [Patescibacteria group bacterium]